MIEAPRTLAVDVGVVPGGVVQTQDGLRCSTVDVFEADMTLNNDQCVVYRLIST